MVSEELEPLLTLLNLESGLRHMEEDVAFLRGQLASIKEKIYPNWREASRNAAGIPDDKPPFEE